MSYKNRLDKLKANWDSDKPVAGAQALPAGKYQFVIKRAFLEESKAKFNKGNLTLVVEAHVLTGNLKGRKTIIRTDLEAKANIDKGWPSGISRFKGMLETLKLDMPKSLSEKDIEKVLKAMINVCFNGTCVVNAKGYSNVYINDLLAAPSEEDDDEEESEDDDDEDDESEDDEEDSESDSEESEDEAEDDEDSDESDEDEEEDEEDEEDDEEEEPAPKKAQPAKATPAKSDKKSSKKDSDDWGDEFDDK